MQLKDFFIAGLLSLAIFPSCSKKHDDVKPTFPVEGNYVGKYSVLSGPYDNYYSFSIETGGALKVQNATGQKTGNGNWELTNGNTVITGTYTLLPPAGGSYSFIANFDKVKGKLDGTWGNGQQEYGGGYWFMNRTN